MKALTIRTVGHGFVGDGNAERLSRAIYERIPVYLGADRDRLLASNAQIALRCGCLPTFPETPWRQHANSSDLRHDRGFWPE
jgi:hypothetical protein